MYDSARGGNDRLIGDENAFYTTLYGDAYWMYDSARGGNDRLIGGGYANQLVGDAIYMYDNSRGGNDRLIGGDNAYSNELLPDARYMYDNAIGGADTFVFAPGSNDDVIGDFRQADNDKIDVSAYGFTSLANMTISDNGTDTLIEFGGAGAANSVTLLGFNDSSLLTGDDFIFA